MNRHRHNAFTANQSSPVGNVADASVAPVCNTGASVTGWGGYALKAPLCKECGRSVYECFCGEWAGDDEMMPAPDVLRAMDALYPNSGWGFSERCALGMPGVRS